MVYEMVHCPIGPISDVGERHLLDLGRRRPDPSRITCFFFLKRGAFCSVERHFPYSASQASHRTSIWKMVFATQCSAAIEGVDRQSALIDSAEHASCKLFTW